MGISSIVTTGILSGALLFGQTSSNMDFPKEIDEGTYNLVPVAVQEINWLDNGDKLNRLHTKSYIDDDGMIHLYSTKDYRDNVYASSSINADNIDSKNYNKENNTDIQTDYTIYDEDMDESNIFNKNRFMYSDMQYLKEIYKDAGYKHIVINFPVTKDEPYYNSKAEFLNKVHFDEIEHIAVFGFASPDGKIPEMQEDLAEKRKNKILSYIKHEEIFIDNAEHFVCDKSVTRSLCWKVDVFYK